MTVAPTLQITAVLLGACLGSFVATAALRAAADRPFLAGCSACDGCGVRLGYLQTVPVVGYVRARGACVRCGSTIDPAHLVGELIGAGVCVTAVSVLPLLNALLVAALGLVLLDAALFDARTQRLPNVLTAVVAVLGATLAALQDALLVGLGAAAAAFLVLEGFRRGFLHLRRKPGLGFGDVKLIAAAALWLGTATPWAVVVASLIGLTAFPLLRPWDGRLPFGPAIALAVWVVGTVKEAGAWPG